MKDYGTFYDTGDYVRVIEDLEAENARLQATLKLLAPYARKAVDLVASPYGNDLAAHWALLAIERPATQTGVGHE